MQGDDRVHCLRLSLLCQVRKLQRMLIFLRKSWRKENWLCLHSSETLLHDNSGWNSHSLLSIFSINFYDQYNFYSHQFKAVSLCPSRRTVAAPFWQNCNNSQVLKKKKHWFGQNWVHNLTLQVTNWIVKYISLFLWNNHLVCGWLDFSKLQLFQLSLQWKY